MNGKRALQLKISLVGSRPPVWRRVLVPDSLTLAQLHRVIQLSMGWTNSHLHQFEIGGERYTESSEDIEAGALDSTSFTLQDVGLRRGGKALRYNYDFGDNWLHDVVVESELTAGPTVNLPRCLGGRRACPPEDCGGVHGYRRLLAAVSDPRHPEHDDMMRWVGPDFDPAAFDAEEVNLVLQRAFRSR